MRKYLVWSLIVILFNLSLTLLYFTGNTPFSTAGFVLLALVFFVLSLKYPRQMFWLFLSTLPLENIIISPPTLPFSLRPFQLLGLILAIALIILKIFRPAKIDFNILRPACLRKEFWRFKLSSEAGAGRHRQEKKIGPHEKYFNPLDRLLLLLWLATILALQNAPDKQLSLKLSLVLFSYLLLYWLVRNFLRTLKDLREGIWFFFLGSLTVVASAFYQMIGEKFAWPTLTVMAERVNATFTEPDWLGMYLVFIIALLLATKYTFKLLNSDEKGELSRRISDLRIFNIPAVRVGEWLLNIFLTLVFIILLATVSRSAWLSALIVFLAYGAILFFRKNRKEFWQELLNFLLIAFFAFFILKVFHLSTFHLSNRAASSVTGLQKITVSCQPSDSANELPAGATIKNLSELKKFGCRHINLEEISAERERGHLIKEVFRPDPNINLRWKIYRLSWQNIKKHRLFGQGLGSSGFILGNDSLGHRYNTSNIFLEVCLSTGLFGLLLFTLLFLTPLVIASKILLSPAKSKKKNEVVATYFLLTFLAILIPNLFNSGFFLAFFWVWLATVIGYLSLDKSQKS